MKQPDLMALHLPFRRRILNNAEQLLTKPFFIAGAQSKANTGILLLHGFSGTPAVWVELVKPLAKLGFTLSGPLLYGHGSKPEDLMMIHWQDWYQGVEDAFYELMKHSRQVVVIGHSLGAALALQLAAKNPLIQKLFLIAPAVYPSMSFQFLINTGLASILKTMGINFLPSIGGNLKKSDAWEFAYPRIAIHALRELYTCMEVTQQILPNIKQPVTIFQAHQDLLVPAKQVFPLMAEIGSTQKELIWLDNSYHVIPLDNDAEILTAQILERL